MDNSTTGTDLVDALRARGDLAVTSLQAIRSTSQNAQIRLLTVVQRLQKMKLPMTTTDGKPTIANVLFSELEIINEMLSDTFTIANTVVLELDALAEHHGVARRHEDTISDIISYIKRSSTTYENMTEAEIRKEFGL